MSTGFANESVSTTLPITGSGPFTLIIGLIGVGAVGIGALMRRLGRGDGMTEASFGVGAARSLGAAAVAHDKAVADEAAVWLDDQLAALRWLDEQLGAVGTIGADPAGSPGSITS